MPRTPVVVYLDYVDPVSYRLYRRLRARLGDVLQSGGFQAELRLLPFELCPPPRPLLDPSSQAWTERWEAPKEPHPEPVGRDAVGGLPALPPHPPSPHPLIPWTRKAHELTMHAAEKERFARIHDALFKSYLIEGRDIGRVDVLVELAAAHGLDRTETKAVLDVDRFSERIAMVRSDAVANGVSEPGTLVTATETTSDVERALQIIDTLTP